MELVWIEDDYKQTKSHGTVLCSEGVMRGYLGREDDGMIEYSK